MNSDTGKATVRASRQTVGLQMMKPSNILNPSRLGALAGRDPFIYYHRLDWALLVGSALLGLTFFVVSILPIESLRADAIGRKLLDNGNMFFFFVFVCFTVVVSFYWLSQVGPEIGSSRRGRYWPNILVVWVVLLLFNCAPFLLATILELKTKNSSFDLLAFIEARSGNSPWNVVGVSVATIALGMLAHGFKIVRANGVFEAMLGLVLGIAMVTVYLIVAVNYGELLTSFFVSPSLDSAFKNRAQLQAIVISSALLWICLLLPALLATQRAVSTRTARVGYLTSLWFVPFLSALVVTLLSVLLVFEPAPQVVMMPAPAPEPAPATSRPGVKAQKTSPAQPSVPAPLQPTIIKRSRPITTNDWLVMIIIVVFLMIASERLMTRWGVALRALPRR